MTDVCMSVHIEHIQFKKIRIVSLYADSSLQRVDTSRIRSRQYLVKIYNFC